MTIQTSPLKRGLGAALAASVADEKKSTEDRFAKAERLHQLTVTAPAVTPEQLAKPLPPSPQPTRAPQDVRSEHSDGGGGAPAIKPPVIHEKVIRDTFTFPPSDHQRIKAIVQEGLQSALSINKSEVIRAGLIALQELPADKRRALLASVEKMQPGRPVE
jgi:hypothetical protein